MRFVIGFLVFVPLLTCAETAYITDKLKLGLHQAEDTSDRAFRTLESGQEMEILFRDRNYAHVQLPDGVQGYVKAAYLVTEKPAKLIVAQTQAEIGRLTSELEETRQAFAGPAQTIDSLKQQAADLQTKFDASSASVAELSEENGDLRGRQETFKNSLPLQWVAGALGVCLLGGFFVGLWWMDNRSRRRHGGIRIY
jgi:SH3 domain protein